jgi:hypothetical protein
MPSSAPTPAERAIAAALYAPIGLGAQLVDDLPGALNAARQQIVFARFIGKMAVDQGVKELRQRIAPPAISSQTDLEQASVQDEAPDEAIAPEQSTELALAPGELALPDYDQLPASHIVSKLAGLTPSELDAIEAYESANRSRRTVLGKIAQLQAI